MAFSAALNKANASSQPGNTANVTPAAERTNAFDALKAEVAGICILVAMAVYFLSISWRKWPDPIVDSGPQLYATWRVSEGARLYHDFLWNYGPLSVCFNATLFKLFGSGIMVLVTANLIFYALIVALIYIAFRMAWGRLAAFASLAVFISVFSFSHLLGVGNYNFVMPYAAEATHGTLLILITAFVVVRWCQKSSPWLALALGLCGGLTAVMKPEFMLAGGVLGIAALILRWRQRVAIRWQEFAMIAAGLVLPTLGFTIWFARIEPFKEAFIDASQAWWLVLVAHIQGGDVQQLNFSGLDNPWGNALKETIYALKAALVMGAMWAAGWAINRPWPVVMRMVTALAAVALASFVRLDGGWISVGRCLPVLMMAIFILLLVRMTRESRGTGNITQGTLMKFALVLLAGTMLARMPLFARVFHLGFFQAALAGMVVTAAMIGELPRWTGAGTVGRGVTVAGAFVILILGCGSIAAKSRVIRADQTEPIGSGRDRIYSTTRMVDGTGALVNWAAEKLRDVPADARVLVLPEGAMINYLSRHKAPEPGWARGQEEEFVERLRKNPPEYVVLISRELKEFGIEHFGAPGNPGQHVLAWMSPNYVIQSRWGGDPLDPKDQVGAIILKRK